MLTWLLLTIDRLVRWPALVAWLALIFALSSIPNEIQGPGGGLPYDKVAHFGEFGVLAFLIAWIASRWRGEAFVSVVTASIGALLSIAYGVTDEIHQVYVPGRDPSWTDLATDALGAVAGAAAAIALSWLLVRRASTAAESASRRRES